MTTLHIVLGAALIAVNLLAGALGTWAWWRERPVRGFWPALRLGQALVIGEAAQGGVLLLQDRELPELHLVYGLTPILVSFVAEQLRLVSAQTVLDQRGIESARAVGGLPEGEQRAIVAAIVRRETGVMAASALVVTGLALRGSGLF